MPIPLLASYLLAVFAVIVVLYFHLLSAALSGLAVYVLTAKLARHLPMRWRGRGRGIALAAIILLVALLVLAAALGLWAFLQGHGGISSLMAAAAERLDSLKQNLPPYLAKSVPDNIEELRAELAAMLREHGKNISHVGMSGARTLVHILAGMVIGAMAVVHHFREDGHQPPLATELHARLGGLTTSFEKVVFAQLKISSINTILTTIYLAVVLPLCGVHLPMVTLLILLTFVAGLLPVIGNLISNSVIVLISLGDSVGAAIGSVVFLLLVHKLEYFLNARIVGGEVEASAWELLTAMLVMEAIFGLAGLVAAPIVYAWLKSELKSAALV